MPVKLASNTSAEQQLLLVHPIGVGLSSRFWDRFVALWQSEKRTPVLLNPDLLGCGTAPCPARPLTPEDWAEPLIHLLRERAKEPVVLVSQGASLPIALAIAANAPELVSGLVAISPPGWRVLTQEFPQSRARWLWRILFDGLIGNLFYRYARRRRFLDGFSRKNLFARPESVDDEWLEMLKRGSRAMDTRWAVYSFLAGFWRRNWEPQLTGLNIPVQILFGINTTGIGSSRNWDDLEERLATYREKLPNASISTITGRNVLPYESTEECVNSVREWITTLQRSAHRSSDGSGRGQ
ncbi:alpha/beta hydrolase family protein [Synechococcus sp. BIOS-E4-1]|nr:alpha/beta hydrolase family protein [Synechococcus sp. BIOS-E4-1]